MCALNSLTQDCYCPIDIVNKIAPSGSGVGSSRDCLLCRSCPVSDIDQLIASVRIDTDI